MFERYTIIKTENELRERFNIEVTDRYRPRYNAAPTQLLPVITNHDPDGFSFFYWGQIPQRSNNKSISSKLINAEAALLSEKASFRNALKSRRCLIPADGFYAWKNIGKRSRVPYRFVLNQQACFAMAGLWEEYEDDQDQLVHTFTVITLPANGVVREVDDRMPAILEQQDEKLWLDVRTQEETLVNLLKPIPEDQIGSYTVSSQINSLKVDRPELVAPAPPNDQFGNYTLFS